MNILFFKLMLSIASCLGLTFFLWIPESKFKKFTQIEVLGVSVIVKMAIVMLMLYLFHDRYLATDPRQYFFKDFDSAFHGTLSVNGMLSAQNPLFCYLVGLWYWCGGALGYVFFMIVSEALIYQCATYFLSVPREILNRVLIFLLWSPLSIIYILVEGQEDAWVMGALIFPLLVIASPLVCGIFYGVLFLGSKLLAIFSLAPVFLLSGKRWKVFTAGFISVLGIACAVFLNSLPKLVQATTAESHFRSTGNLFSIISLLFPLPVERYMPFFVSSFIGLSVGMFVFLRKNVFLKKPGRQYFSAFAYYIFIWCVFLIFSPKSLGACYLSFFPLYMACYVVREKKIPTKLIWMQLFPALHHVIYFRNYDLANLFGGAAARVINEFWGIAILVTTCCVAVQSVKWLLEEAKACSTYAEE